MGLFPLGSTDRRVAANRSELLVLAAPDVDEAFETPYLEDLCPGTKVTNLTRGALALPPRRGEAVLFFSHGLDGAFDERSLHGGCPVRGGAEKLIVQVFFSLERVREV